MKKQIITQNAKETFLIGESLGKTLQGGEVICLYGELGAGKTVFAKGLAKGLEIKREITSPTFTMIQEYPIEKAAHRAISFIHMDLYRLKHPEEAEIIGVMDYFRDDCICLLEWPEIISEYLPADRLEIYIEGSGDLPRVIQIMGGL